VGGRGRRHGAEERRGVLDLIAEAVVAGARVACACTTVGLDKRTYERWRTQGIGEDRRRGPNHEPKNKLSEVERKLMVMVLTSPMYRDLSPKQVVPLLAEAGRYIASESTAYRLLRAEGLLAHRESSRPRQPAARPKGLKATAPNQVWCWDITYLPAAVRGQFYYLYLVEDLFSRKIVGWEVHDVESMEMSAAFIARVQLRLGIKAGQVTLHSDNGGPMRGATMLATLQSLGIATSFSRPHVSDDNPFPESLFRTLKYRPEYPRSAFTSLEGARTWVDGFVAWYNTEHLHSSLNFVRPADRHNGSEATVLAHRREVYERARERHPERWARGIRNCEPIGAVTLNPEVTEDETLADRAA
jgi:transposase InsO family protein